MWQKSWACGFSGQNDWQRNAMTLLCPFLLLPSLQFKFQANTFCVLLIGVSWSSVSPWQFLTFAETVEMLFLRYDNRPSRS